MSIGLYFWIEEHGIYEIVRVSEDLKECLVVQTNIRTKEKAKQACEIWQQRELDVSVGAQTETR